MMRNFAVVILLAVSTIARAANVFAQDGEMLELQAEMAEAAYLSSKSDARLGEAVGAYEKLILLNCSSEVLAHFDYQGEPKSEKCRSSIERVLAMDGGNPVALCARDGFNRRTCREMTELQLEGTYDESTGSWSSDDHSLGGKIETLDTAAAVRQKSLASKVDSLKSKLYGLESTMRSPRQDKKALDKFRPYIAEGIKLTCTNYKVALSPLTKPANVPTPARIIPDDSSLIKDNAPKESGSARSKSSVGELLDKFEKILPSATPTIIPLALSGTEHSRVRLIPIECGFFIKSALLLDPLAAAPTCISIGQFSPQCADAKRREAEKAPAPQEAGPSSGGGFVSF